MFRSPKNQENTLLENDVAPWWTYGILHTCPLMSICWFDSAALSLALLFPLCSWLQLSPKKHLSSLVMEDHKGVELRSDQITHLCLLHIYVEFWWFLSVTFIISVKLFDFYILFICCTLLDFENVIIVSSGITKLQFLFVVWCLMS